MSSRYYLCRLCKCLAHVTGEEDELSRLGLLAGRLGAKCVTGHCSGAMDRCSPSAGGAADHTLTFQEFLSALGGFGLPSEIDASPEVVQAMLLAHRVVGSKIAATRSGKRTVLTELLLDNGATLHIAGGGDGPTVYKITRRQSGYPNTELREIAAYEELQRSPNAVDEGREGYTDRDVVSNGPGARAQISALSTADLGGVHGGLPEAACDSGLAQEAGARFCSTPK